jgi:hypothetical protein
MRPPWFLKKNIKKNSRAYNLGLCLMGLISSRLTSDLRITKTSASPLVLVTPINYFQHGIISALETEFY